MRSAPPNISKNHGVFRDEVPVVEVIGVRAVWKRKGCNRMPAKATTVLLERTFLLELQETLTEGLLCRLHPHTAS